MSSRADASHTDLPARGLPDLAALTGVRSSKRSYYREFQRSSERLEETISAVDRISGELVRTVEGPRALLEQVLHAASSHLRAQWTVFALADGALIDSRPRLLARTPDGRILDDAATLPAEALREVAVLQRAELGFAAAPRSAPWVRAPMLVDGQPVGGLSGLHGLGPELDDADRSVLGILANQAAVSMHTSDLYQSGLALRRRAQRLYDEVSEQARVLAVKTEELNAAEYRLRAAEQSRLLDDERRRIALELHDSVAQTVLSAGLTLEALRGDAGALPGGDRVAADLVDARNLMATAGDQLRALIYALHHSRADENLASLPELLQEMAGQHGGRLPVIVRIEGRPLLLGTRIEHSLARTAGEALFNVASHANASRALVRLRYGEDSVRLSVSDDGEGDPAVLRRTLRLRSTGIADGRHRGLVGMAERAAALDGILRIRRSRLGGVRVEVDVPVPSGTPTTGTATIRGEQPC